MGRCKSLGSWKSWLWYVPHLSRASTLYSHPEFPHQLTLHAGCSGWWCPSLLLWQEKFHFSEVILDSAISHLELPRWYSVKKSACQCRRCNRQRFHPWVKKIPRNRKWQPTPVFLPGEFHGQRTLAATLHGFTKSWTCLSMHRYRIIPLCMYTTSSLSIHPSVDFRLLPCLG